jgi:lipopolysaccharide/colanic/teichoic acid biosynthesis glycosyltransferase
MKKFLLNSIIIVVDLLVLIGIFYLTLSTRIGINTDFIPVFKELSLSNFYFVIFIIFALMYNEKIYSLRYDFWQETKKIFRSLVIAYFIVLAMLALAKISMEYSRLFITMYFIFAIIIMPIAKRYTKKIIYRQPFFKKNVLIVGDEEQVRIFKKEYKDNWYLGMRCDDEDYDTVVISSKNISLEDMNKEIDKYLHTKSSVYIIPYVTNMNFANSNIMEYSNIRFNTIQIENKLLIKGNLWIKHSFDFIALIVTMPFFLVLHTLIAIAIKLDSKGPVFFKQHRLGRNDNDFVCYKYRTMYENSDNLLQEYLKNNPSEIEYYQKFHKYKNDPRITKVGKFLRESSLDELAQIINIMKGEMSFVGPRPYMLNESDKLGSKQHMILKVNPGITGLWQVSGRNDLTFKERNDLEVWYIKNWSLWYDFVILIKTIKVVLFKIGAK